MLRYSDMPAIGGPLADPHNPTFCQRCEHRIYFECDNCKAMLGSNPDDTSSCPHCGSQEICGPMCICTKSDCGED